MGFWRQVFTGSTDEPALVAAAEETRGRLARFGVTADPGVLYGTPTLDDFIFRTGRISRSEALRVPAVKRARDLIAGGIGQFPLRAYDPTGKVADTFSPSLFSGQVEAGVAPTVTWTRVVEDMMLFGRAWLRVIEVGWHGKPATVRRLEADTVTVQPAYVQYPEGSALVWPERPGLIRIDSPNGGLLDCSPAVRACIALERAALMNVDGIPPIEYFTPTDDADPFEDDTEIADFLDDWTQARRDRTTGYVPASVKLNEGGWDPEKLQLAQARDHATLEVARLTGIDPEDLGVSTTSRTYFNAQDRRRTRVEDVYGPYMAAIEGRLTMEDVTPRGYTGAFDPSGYLRLDDLAAAQADSVLIAAKVLLPEEAREKRNLDPAATPAPAADPAEDTAAIDGALARGSSLRVEQVPVRPTNRPELEGPRR